MKRFILAFFCSILLFAAAHSADAALDYTKIAWEPAPGAVAYYILEASQDGSPFEVIARTEPNVSEVELVIDPDVVWVARVGACNVNDVCVFGPEGVLVAAPRPTPNTTPEVPGLPGAPITVSITVNVGS